MAVKGDTKQEDAEDVCDGRRNDDDDACGDTCDAAPLLCLPALFELSDCFRLCV